MLKINDLSVSYGPVTALIDVTIDVPKGKIVSIIGSNGAGKTSLLNTISGLVKKQKGEILMEGSPLPNAPHKIVRGGVVHVPEGRKIFPELTVDENLIIASATGQKGVKEKSEEIYALFPILHERCSQHAGTLSGGEQQMLAIARGMMSNPKILMLDEPSLGLAPVIVKQVFKFIKQINERGITILLIEQNARQAMGLSDYTYVLENGHITMQGESAVMLENEEIRKAYLGE
ncbi:ABC transporter ATP-binding protein [Ruminococcaceae bacterium OttesenSCG-928-D13]|nr:ABC transporter ATP-binding protein [Ruminococcaceae bacterium OttesenSCG-928-D13]